MDKNDKQILDMLEKELKNEAEKVNVPLRLQKESIVKMLKDAEKDFSAETENAENSGGKIKAAAFSNESKNDSAQLPDSDGTAVISGKNNIVMLRKLAAIAAMLAIVITGTMVMKPRDNVVKAVGKDLFHEGLKDKAAVKDPDSMNDIVQAISEISKNKNKDESAAAQPVTHVTQTKDNNIANEEVTSAPAGEQTTDVPATIIGSYEDYVAGSDKEPIKTDDSNEASAPVIPERPEGIATYGEFREDIVKTDGKKYIYKTFPVKDAETSTIVEQIKIIEVSGGTIKDVSTIVLSENAGYDSIDESLAIYLIEGRLVVVMGRCEYNGERWNNSTVALYYDVSDPYNPVKIREHIQDGKYVSSSHYEGKLCLVTEMPTPDNIEAESNATPAFTVDGVKVELKPEDVRIAAIDAEASYLFITVTDSTDFTKGVGRFAFLGGGNNIYCSSSAVVAVRDFVSVEENKNGEHSTFAEVHRINIEGSNVKYSGWYRLQGDLVGGISVDDNSGYLRAITTNDEENRLYIIDKYMQDKDNKVYRINLDGQKPTRVNFTGTNCCYVMYEDEEGEHTAIIDLSDLSSTELSCTTIPKNTFTDSLYALSDTMVIEISGAKTEIIKDENGVENTVFRPAKLTLFDVSDPQTAKITAVYEFDKNVSLIEPFDSSCLFIDTEKKIFGIPVLIDNAETGEQISAYRLFRTSNAKLEPLGDYVHSASYIGDAASRGVCIGDVFYSVSGMKVVAFDISATAAENNKLSEFPLN